MAGQAGVVLEQGDVGHQRAPAARLRHEADAYIGLSSESGHRPDTDIESEIMKEEK